MGLLTRVEVSNAGLGYRALKPGPPPNGTSTRGGKGWIGYIPPRGPPGENGPRGLYPARLSIPPGGWKPPK